MLPDGTSCFFAIAIGIYLDAICQICDVFKMNDRRTMDLNTD